MRDTFLYFGLFRLRSNPKESGAEAWANTLIAYVMAFSAVRAFLAALADGRTPSANLENEAALANWSKSYSVNATWPRQPDC
jgi:hypothetical protein